MSEIYLNEDCKTKIHLIDNNRHTKSLPFGSHIIEKHGFFVIDNIKWNCNFNIIQKALEHECRIFDDKFRTIKISPEVEIELRSLHQQRDELTELLFSDYEYERNGAGIGFRPMVTGPEWMHFDSKLVDRLLLTSYINLDRLPRIYKIGPTFPYLIKYHKKEVKRLYAKGKAVAVNLREETVKNQGLINNLTPKHTVILDPGTVWYFNPMMISHEVVFGRGTAGQSWWVNNSNVKTQTQMLKEMK